MNPLTDAPTPWRILSADERVQQDAEMADYWAARALHEARVDACGDHDWLLTLLHPDEGNGVELDCVKCHAGMDDVVPDGLDFLCVVANGVDIACAGIHIFTYAAQVPVTLTVQSFHHSSPNGDDWDIEITATTTGPIEILEEWP